MKKTYSVADRLLSIGRMIKTSVNIKPENNPTQIISPSSEIVKRFISYSPALCEGVVADS
jgi:hypothetical protein